MLPGDQDGYWGPITGFDFCERNYVTSQYVGEMGCMMTNFISLPVYLIIAAYVYANGAKLAPLTYVYLVFAFFDMFSAGMSHGTLLMPWTHAQEWVLGGCYLFFFIVMCIRYNESRLCKVIILIMSGSRVVDGAIEVFMEGFDSKFTGASPIVDFLGRAVPIISIVGMVGLFIFGRDFVARLLACETLIIVPAFYIFGITEVNAKNCYDLPIWLHEVGHLLGALSDYCAVVVVVGLDPYVKERMRIGLKYYCLPGLFPKSVSGVREGLSLQVAPDNA
jgi:hypothetical protein